MNTMDAVNRLQVVIFDLKEAGASPDVILDALQTLIDLMQDEMEE